MTHEQGSNSISFSAHFIDSYIGLNVMRKLAGYFKKHYYICYTLLFLIVCVSVFGIFWYNGKSFVWSSSSQDGLCQHYTAYLYYGRYLRSVAKSILFDHTLSIPSFSMSIGYGSDIITTLCYYVVGDPICALTIFIPSRFMLYFYNFSVLLRLYLSGITFSKLCFYIKNRGERVYGKTAIMIGTFIYVFCGFTLFFSVRHPYFMNPMIYFPLVLLGIEMLLDKEKPYIFILGVFLSAISNFYFFYMIVILTVLYVIWRLVFVYHKNEIKEVFCSLSKITGYSILGTAMSAAILLPAILSILGDSRGDSGYLHTIFYTLSDYQKNLSGFVAINTSHDWLYMGYAAVALLAIFMLFMQKKQFTNIKVAFIVMIIMLSLPIAGKIMNANLYVNNRWIWGFSLLIGYIVVLMWDRLFTSSFKEKIKLTFCLCVYFIICMFMTQSRTIDFFMPMVLAFIFLCFLLLRSKKYQTVLTSACFLCVFVNILMNALFMYSPRFNNYISEFADNKDFFDDYNKTEANVINWLVDDDEDVFYRYTGSITRNRTLYTGLHSTQYFWSLSNGNIGNFLQESGLNYGILNQYDGLDSRASLSTLANVKYYVKASGSTSAAPYGFENIGFGTDYSLSDYLKRKFGEDYDVSSLSEEEKQTISQEYLTGYDVYENENALPFGYTYSDYITRNSYDSLTTIQKQESMLQAVVLEEDDGEESTPVITSKSIDYTIDQLDGVNWEDNKIIVTKENGTATVQFSGLSATENYLYIKGLNYTGISPMEQFSNIEWSLKSTYDKNSIKYQEKFWTEPSEFNLDFASKNIDDDTVYTSIRYKTPYNMYYNDQHDYLVSLYYDEFPRESITITFPKIGTYTYEDIEVLCQPMDNYDEQIEALKADVLEDVDFHDNNSAFATDEVTGNISLDQDKYLLLTIPYSSGWTAYVDGEEQELLQANTMYMALKLNAGDHSIELKYHTPGLTVGLCISLAAFITFIFVIVFHERRNKMAKNNEKGNIEERHEQ